MFQAEVFNQSAIHCLQMFRHVYISFVLETESVQVITRLTVVPLCQHKLSHLARYIHTSACIHFSILH